MNGDKVPDSSGNHGKPAARWRRAIQIPLLIIAMPAVLILVPEGRLRCDEPYYDDKGPDGWTLTICRRPMIFAMPGGASDAPGWIVLRDGHDGIRGVVHLEMVQLLAETQGQDVVWGPERVSLPFLAKLPRNPSTGPVEHWLTDRIWRLRAWIGLTPVDENSQQWS